MASTKRVRALQAHLGTQQRSVLVGARARVLWI
jgi:hypothetical protein